MGYQFLSLGRPTPPPPSRGSHLYNACIEAKLNNGFPLPLYCPSCHHISQIMFSCCSFLFMARPSWGSHLMGAQKQYKSNIIAVAAGIINECGWIKFPVGNRHRRWPISQRPENNKCRQFIMVDANFRVLIDRGAHPVLVCQIERKSGPILA